LKKYSVAQLVSNTDIYWKGLVKDCELVAFLKFWVRTCIGETYFSSYLIQLVYVF